MLGDTGDTKRALAFAAGQDKSKKRLRMSVVCLNCKARKIKCDKKKPCCTNCVKSNVGHLCQYESPHWINRVKTSDGIPITVAAATANGNTPIGSDTSDSSVRALNSNIMGSLLPDSLRNGGIDQKEFDDLQEEVIRLRRAVRELGGHRPLETPLNDNYEITFNDTVDFYESYKTLTVKRSGMDEHKPLSCSAFEFKDKYALVMVGYFKLGVVVYTHRVLQEKRRDKGSKNKKRLDASVSESLHLLGEEDIPDVQAVVSNFIQERTSNAERASINFPNIGGKGSKEETASLKTKIEESLPPKYVIKLYLNRFYEFIYPYFPFVHRDFFDDRVFNTVLVSSDDRSPTTLNLEEKFDWILIATLLIILRLTFVTFPEPEFLKDEEKELLKFPIDPSFITNALSCLSSFKILRKTKLSIVQCLLYLRIYFIYAPEDGDGVELTQSQIFFGLIVQSAYTIGLNRDASFHFQMSHDKEFSNLWRKVWWGIVEQDRCLSAISGYPCLIPTDNTFNTKFPQTSSDDPQIESAISQEFERSYKISKLYADLSSLVNNIANPAKVTEILSLLKQMKNYLEINFSSQTLEPLTGDPANNLLINVRNVRRLLHTVTTLSLTTTVHQHLWLHFESKNHYDMKKLKYFQQLTLETTITLANIIYKFFNGGFSKHIDPNHLPLLNRFISNSFQRVFNSLSGFITRLYHTSDLISRTHASTTAILKLDLLKAKLFKIATGMLVLVQNTLGRQYYLTFKSSLRYKFLLRSLKNDGFKCIRDTMTFINAKYNSDPKARVTIMERVQFTSNPEMLLADMDNTNNFVNLLPTEVDQFLSMADGFDILQDESYTNDDLIWEHSFKERPKKNQNGIVVNGRDRITNPMAAAAASPFTSTAVPQVANDPKTFGDSLFLSFEQLINDESFVNFDNNDPVDQDTNLEKFDWLFKL